MKTMTKRLAAILCVVILLLAFAIQLLLLLWQ